MQIKPLDAFDRAARGLYGREARCKECKAAKYRESHPLQPPRPRPKRREAFTGSEMKTCAKCEQAKPLTEFSLSRRATETTNAVYRTWCKSCSSARATQWFRDNPERALNNQRRLSLAKLYGITVEEYDAMLAAQNGGCAVCGKDEPAAHGRTGKKFMLSVDHDHATGKVRGLLCQRCNRAIGMLDDDPALLQRAISYLARNGDGAHILTP